MNDNTETNNTNYKTLCFVLLTDMANDNDIDVNELFERYGFNRQDIEDYHKWF